jgi:hypothetical protein
VPTAAGLFWTHGGAILALKPEALVGRSDEAKGPGEQCESRYLRETR